MGLTHDETRLFASLWLKAGANSVLETRDADLVSQTAMNAAEALLAPCVRDHASTLPIGTVEPPKRSFERYSSWVH